ncbi:MAG: TM2 domain-containing protein [Candidatus Aminicenantes bacterium]|nr:TM2 domain-containing protein [Candidatus Aminicenantes bacterium]
MSEKSRIVTLMLCGWFGMFGAHRFHVGKTGTGIVWLLTFGVFGLGILFDLVMIVLGKFYDKDNKPVLAWFKMCDAQGNVVYYGV